MNSWTLKRLAEFKSDKPSAALLKENERLRSAVMRYRNSLKTRKFPSQVQQTQARLLQKQERRIQRLEAKAAAQELALNRVALVVRVLQKLALSENQPLTNREIASGMVEKLMLAIHGQESLGTDVQGFDPVS